MTAPGDFSSGDVLTAADMNDLPAGVVTIAYNASSTQSFGTTPTDIATDSPTLQTGRIYLISFTAYFYNNSVSGAQYTARVVVGATTTFQLSADTSSTTQRIPVSIQWPFSVASAGATTVAVQGYVSSGTGAITNGVAQELRYTLLDIGPTL